MAHSYPKGCTFQTLESIKGKKITIMGLGLNGGGEACVRFLYKHGAILTVTDMKTKEALQSTLNSLENDSDINCSKIKFVLGCHNIEDFEQADCVIKNPGVKYDGNKFLAAAKAIETDISLFLQFSNSPIIAVTGSKGKSSTVSAVYYGLKQAGFDTFLGGNITVSPLTFLEKTSEKTPVVLELSSWQLADLRGRNLLKPFVSLLTLIVPDHQNWYGNMESYIADKKLIYADQTQNQFTICNYDQDWGHTFASETCGKVLWYSKVDQSSNNDFAGVYFDSEQNGFVKKEDGTIEQILKDVKVPGFHSKQNILNACLVLKLMNVDESKIQKIMAEYAGIEHRLENAFQCKIGDKTVNFFNDSAATVPDATVAAINAFKNPPILISGGTDKNLDFTPFVESKTKPSSVYFLEGSATQKVLALLNGKNLDNCKTDENATKDNIFSANKGVFSSLDELLIQLKKDLQANQDKAEYDKKTEINVVFSPGATSFGMFKNEFDRGNQFKAKVKEIFG